MTLVHLALATQVAGILRAGVRAAAAGPDGAMGVWCQPVLAAYALPEARWRELRRGGHRSVMAVHVELPASLPVRLSGADGEAAVLPAGEALAAIEARPDPHAWQVFVPRSITRREIRLVRHVPSTAAGPLPTGRRDPAQRPHPRPGRQRLDPTQRPLAKPQLLAALVGSIDPAEADEAPRPTQRHAPDDP